MTRHNSYIKYKARIKKITYECDLTILYVDSNEFCEYMSLLFSEHYIFMKKKPYKISWLNYYEKCMSTFHLKMVCYVITFLFFNIIDLFCHHIFQLLSFVWSSIVINCMEVNHISRCNTINPPRYYIFEGFVFVPYTHAYVEDYVIYIGCEFLLCETKSMINELETGE